MAHSWEQRILRCWRMLELFNPQPLPSLQQGKKKENNTGEGSVRVVEFLPGVRRLPWEEGVLPVAEPKDGVKVKVWEHHVYLGVYSVGDTYTWLHRVFDDDADAYEQAPSQKSACAALVVNQDGEVVKNSGVLSSALWAVGQLRNLDGGRPDWDGGFRSADAGFAEVVNSYLGAGCLRHGELFELLEAAHRLAGVVGLSGLARSTVRVKSFLVSVGREDPPRADFLNSFFLEDLARVADAGVRPGSALESYLTPDKSLNRARRVDVVKNPRVLAECTAPERIPGGRWPANPAHGLALSQQFAVNRALHELSATTDVLGVNGPPGTGKTTMLRDVVAGNVVERARRLARLERPGDAFKQADPDNPRAVRELKPEFTGFEMVVASSNNSAVENISTEIPAVGAIDEAWRESADYFKDTATAVLRTRGGFEKASAWGLIAAALGNKENRSKFCHEFWFGEDALAHVLRKKVKPKNWNTARAEFDKAEQKVAELVRERAAMQQRLARRAALVAQVAEDEVGVEKHATRLAELEQRCRVEAHELEESVRHCDQAQEQYERTMQQKPGWLEVLFSLGKASQQWRPFAARDGEALRVAAQQLAEVQAALSQAEGARDDAAQELQRRNDELVRHRQELGEAQRQCAPDKAQIGASYPDEDWVGDKQQLHAPWLEKELDKRRSELFLAALELHKDFITNNAKIMDKALGELVDLLNKGTASRPLAVWQIFFLVVPVVSTTFASMERMFCSVGEESLGWLFIDEAGQAAPQQAVGAIWRFHRVVAVGYPLQLEPVVTMPEKAKRDIASTFDVPEEWLPPRASVQTLADRITPYGTTLESTGMWISSPLRVHRRCDDPMFSLCNQIAYNGIMVDGVHRAAGGIFEQLVDCYWADSPAVEFGTHVQRNDLDRLKDGLTYLMNQGVKPSNIIAIAPFRDVAAELKKISEEKDEEGKKRYLGLRAGTIHTAQGREADVVFVVLSADPDRVGAKNWVSEKPNLINVAISRAKRRVYVIGDYERWKTHRFFDVIAAELPARQRDVSDGEEGCP